MGGRLLRVGPRLPVYAGQLIWGLFVSLSTPNIIVRPAAAYMPSNQQLLSLGAVSAD